MQRLIEILVLELRDRPAASDDELIQTLGQRRNPEAVLAAIEIARKITRRRHIGQTSFRLGEIARC